MRRIWFVAATLLALSSVGFSQRADLSGLKFCIDPGHGGYFESDDRHVVPDPGTDFWESESNLQKAFLLDTLLRARGATTILTRTTNNYPNNEEPSVTARAAFANANNVDWMHSIHSNAIGNGLQVGTSINITLLLVREKRSLTDPNASSGNGLGVPERQESWTIANIMSPAIRSRLRTNSNSTSLDWTFYGGTSGGISLGVLRGLLMPGELSEGSMHDYAPETRRLMNNSYRKMEAYALRNSFMQYFGVPPDTMGIIAGIQNEFGTGKNINLSRVRLLPSNRVYTGDSYNNGFYMFDNISPGTYTVRFETPGYSPDSAVVLVGSGSVNFIDRSFLSFAYPTVLAHTPADNEPAFDASQPVTINFSKPMDTASVRKAFSITPSVRGAFVWSNSNSTLGFDPDSILPFLASFTVRIDTSARSIDGKALDASGDGIPDPFQLMFTTKYVDVVPPQLVYLFPGSLDTVTTTGQVVNMTFAERLKSSTITLSNIAVQEVGASLMTRTFEYYEAGTKGAIVMYFTSGLKEGKTYKSRITGVSDLAGNAIPVESQTLWYFTVRPDAYNYVTIDSVGSTPSSFRVSEVVGGTAVLSMVSSPKLGGTMPNSGAARVDYSWDSTVANASCRIAFDSLSPGAQITRTSRGHILQSYVFGDASGNQIQLAVRDSLPNGTVRRVLGPAMQLNWLGWRLLEWDLEHDTLAPGQPIPHGVLRFDGFALRRLPGASARSGQIGFDQIQMADLVVSGVDDQSPFLPLSYAFHQNYPNPFNPSTTFTFDLPLTGNVSLVVYDVLGREVRTLVNAVVEAGRHSYRWDAHDGKGMSATSGVYFVRLNVMTPQGGNAFSAVRKILLTK